MQKIAEVVKRILSRRSSISISWLFATFVVGGAFNYLYHLVTGRLLGPARYSVVATFIAFQLAIMAPLNVLIPIFSDLTTRNIESETQGKIKSVFRYVSLGLWAVGIISLGMMLVFSDVLERWIGISGVPVILMFGVFVMLNMHFPAASGILQGWKDFRAMGFLRLFSGFNRLVFTLVLLGAGLGLDGALGGMTLGTLATILFVFVLLRRKLAGYQPIAIDQSYFLDELLKPSAFFAIAALVISVTFLADIFLIKRLFDAEIAGYYLSASTLARIPLYLLTPLLIYLFPHINEQYIKNESYEGNRLAKASAFVLLLSGVFTVVYYLLPRTIIRSYYGANFLPAAEYLGPFSVAMIPYGVATLQVIYHRARHEWRHIWLVFAIGISQVGVMWFFLKTPLAFIWAKGIFGLLMIVACEVWLGGIIPKSTSPVEAA